MKYVTYDESGDLTGAYWQDLRPEHAAAHIEVSDDAVFDNWVDYHVVDGSLVEIVREAVPPTVADYVAALEHLFDTVAHSRRYDNRYTCALRAGYPGPFQADGIAFATWMDTCNSLAYGLLAQFEAGQIAQPSVQSVVAAMPDIEWPA